jgi:hypothetical protein
MRSPDWELKGLVTDRTGKFKWAQGQVVNGISRDMQALASVLRIGTDRLTKLELENPATRRAILLKQGQLNASIIRAVKTYSPIKQILASRPSVLAAKPRAQAKPAGPDRRVIVAAALAAAAFGVVFAVTRR